MNISLTDDQVGTMITTFQKQIDTKKQAIASLRESIRGDEQVIEALMQSNGASNEVSKASKQGRIPWTEMAIDLLRQSGHFLTNDDIFDHIHLNRSELFKGKSRFDLKKMKANMTKSMSGATGYFGQYKDKFGLRSWFDVNGMIKPDFRKDFLS